MTDGAAPTVTTLRRYPVKAMGGESLESTVVFPGGIPGDRVYAVMDDDGFWASGKNSRRMRRHDEIFGYRAQTAADGTVLVTGEGQTWPADSSELGRHLTAGFGVPLHLSLELTERHHDSAPLSLIGSATLRWCAEHYGGSPDPRRFRVNITVETDEPFIEESWIDRAVRIGSAELLVTQHVRRCRMIDLDQDGVSPGVPWLRRLGQDREACLAVYAEILTPGWISVGDPLLATQK